MDRNKREKLKRQATAAAVASLRNGDAVEIRRSKYETKLVRLSNKSFCDILQKKMLMGVLGHEE